MKKQPLIILTGPTAVGKTELSIKLAKAINGEIISADSCQVYKGMDIGSAKITKKEMDGVPHHLIDILNPDETFDVFTFQRLAKEEMAKIWERGCIPIITGGTGFYIQALLYDISFADETSLPYRDELERIVEDKGNHYLHQMLHEVDPVSADVIHENNVKRVIRALEFYKVNHYPISEHNEKEHEKNSPYDFLYFVLNNERETVYQRIDKRVEIMLQNGLVEEVEKLKALGYDRNLVSMQALGYREIQSYLAGEITLEEAKYLIKRNTRHFAKRQLTWFRRERDVIWINKQDYVSEDEVLKNMLKKM